MKKVLITLLILAVAVPVFATIQNQNVQDLITAELKQARQAAISTRNSLNARRDKMLSINTNYGAEINADDLTKLSSIFSDIVAAANALDALGINIDTNFPTIQE